MQWIKCSERLPEMWRGEGGGSLLKAKSTQVLVLTCTGRVREAVFAHYVDGLYWVLEECWRAPFDAVTHWMPLLMPYCEG